ncbi:ECF-type sigma factor [Brevundimonas naejangsanensis]|uniref:ECF-type sigma factor n=1 Tax=Brevundimonas naejangsanensis TaxID=588932 RepID=UPI0026EA7A37|nr:ECF-type sigma factor [Brevundimonas naejangsanensis]
MTAQTFFPEASPEGASPSAILTSDSLTLALYAELKQVSRRERLRAGRPETWRTTAVMNEAYVRLRRQDGWESREHFLGTAAQAMRHVLVDVARARLAEKRGAGQRPLPLDDVEGVLLKEDREVVRLNEALETLAVFDPRLTRIVECRFFAGYTDEETAQILGVSARTVRRDWSVAKAWLYRELAED